MRINTWSKFNDLQISEGWKHNFLLSLSLLMSGPLFSRSGDKISMDHNEKSIDYTKDFWRACFQVCEELKSPKMSIEERSGILEAQLYFQAKRDGSPTKKMSDKGTVVYKIIMEKVSNLTNEQIDDLIRKGSSGYVSGFSTGL